MAAASIRRRFLREAEAASRLDHPHIVPVYEVGEEGPICYIASAYCEGPTLAEWRRGRTTPVPWSEAARLVAVLATAVAHAHQRGSSTATSSRAISCSSLVSEPPLEARQTASDLASYVPRICDFGLAKLLDEVSQETCSGLAIGSPPYMAPEQAAGRIREQGPATDVYALGVILYELLTGRPPIRGETDLETLRLVADQDPPSPRALRPGLPRDLETICLKCLEKRPERRYAGAVELAADLGRFLEGRPIRARRASAWERAWKWARRRPVHAALAAAVATVVLGGLGGLEWARLRERRHNDELRETLARSLRSEAEERKHREMLGPPRVRDPVEAGRVARGVGRRGPRPDHPGGHRIGPRAIPGSRGFAWSYLARLTRQPVATLPALRQRVRAVATSPDGRTIALADDAQQVYLMDLESGRPRALPGPHPIARESSPRLRPRRPHAGRDSPGRHPVAWGPGTTSPCGTSRRARRSRACPRISGWSTGSVFSPDGRSLVTVEATGAHHPDPVRLWAISDDRRRVTLREHLCADQLAARLAPAPRCPARSPGRSGSPTP